MNSLKPLALLFLSLVLFAACAAAQKSNMNGKTRPAPPRNSPDGSSQQDFKVLAEGQQSGVEEPFVYIARTPETYARLAALAENLPAASEIDFRQTAIVAAYAGMKPTGGYAVEIARAGEKIAVSTNSPPKGTMRAQVITTPFKIVAVSIENDRPVSLSISADWTGKMQKFQIGKGNFEFSGGIAGRQTRFATQGELKVLTQGDLITVIFDLQEVGSEKSRRLSDVASGAIADGNIALERIDAGSFVDNPHPPLKAAGKINGNSLTLNFESHQPTIADGFVGRGMLAAVKVK